ncbi:agrin isoform X4 [Folsomia candida]|uniref:agrin isoform X4 n=1 Tax=Folsomia candida TaxID=158441 RepID=UPI0016050128|nr:agrin isoform X4 [Folsomia candida]
MSAPKVSVIMVVACLTICSTLKRVNAEGGEEMSDSEVSYPSTTTIAPLLLPPPPLRFSRSRMGLEKRSSCWSSSLALVQGGGGQRRDGANLIITGRVEGIITAPSEHPQHPQSETTAELVASDVDIDTDVDGFGYKLREKSSSPPSAPKLKSLSVTSRRFGFTLDHFLSQTLSSQHPAEKEEDHQPALAVRIRVKRVVRGDRSLESTLVLAWVSLPTENLVKCGTKLRLRDTRIFILGVDMDGRMVIRVPPLPVTLAHLQLVNRLSNRPDEPCEQANCAFGESCVVEGGRPTCRCPQTCSNAYSPVCGSDDVTYSNECLLRQFACQHRHSVRIKHSGECDKPDPCADKACLFGSRCVASADGHYASCECPDSCPNYGDSDDSQPVCGSDGQFYKNKCELDRQACHLGRNITVKYVGKCDPCDDIECSTPQICHLDEDRRPMCRCGESCSMDFAPICGSDGKTYSNECIMRQEACRSRRDLRIIYRGKCSSGVNPCESRTCHGYESCAINRFGIAQCVCVAVCDPVFRPVCGDNGRTYDNECELTLSSCRESRNTSVAFKGTCEGNVCSKHRCPVGAVCSERGGIAVCDCPSCPSDYDPVCGSNGVSYQNPCRLQHEACTSNQSIRVIYNGLCNLIRDFSDGDDGCDQTQCDFYSVCETDLSGGAKCVCPQNCTQSTQAVPKQPGTASVCGTDGKLYENECIMRQEACLQQKFIVVASRGFCDLCENVQCKFGARCEKGFCVCPTECPLSRDPVCGSDFLTYTNECELQKAACRLGHSLTVHFYGECVEGLVPHRAAGGTPTQPPPPANGLNKGRTWQQQPQNGLNNEGRPTLLNSNGGGVVVLMGPASSKLCDSIHCEHGSVCEIGGDSYPRCTCQFNCTFAPGSPICASDLKLYPTDCEMRREACHRQTELRPRPMELCEELEVRPCNGEDPLKNGEGVELNCGSGPYRNNCPAGSFCHRGQNFAKCCKKEEKSTTTAKPQNNGGLILSSSSGCDDSVFGCCPDGKTAALGENNGGCPSMCLCNKLGSIRETCDPDTKECDCRPGVGGTKCDRCLPGYWGLARRQADVQQGCRACGCSRFGSVREDCEQMTGRCVCKASVLGHKCDSCVEGEFLSPYGCTTDPTNLGRNCDEVVCTYGAECEQDGDRAGCMCNIVCSDMSENEQEVCGSDGFTYESECLVRLQSCRDQKPIWVVHKGPCPDSSESDGTESPIRRWTGMNYFTEPGDDGIRDGFGSGMKSTRHLPQSKQDNFYKNFYNHRSPTSATVQVRSYLGDSCGGSSECIAAHSVCLGGWCICREGYYEDPERIQCKPIHSHLSGTISCSKGATMCEPEASCFDHRNGSYSCVCPLGRSLPEDNCEHKDYPSPLLYSRSTIKLGKLAGYHKLSLEIEVVPFLNFSHGILVFSSQHANGSGDFFSLALIDGYVEFRYDLGDGPAILRSSSRLISGSNYHIMAKRYNRDGLLRVEGEDDIKGTSPGSMKSLNLDHGGYLGFTPLNSTKIWETVGTSEGFVGCIHRLKVGRRPIEFEDKDPLVNSFHKVSQCPLISRSGRLTTTPIYVPAGAGGEEDEEEQAGDEITGKSRHKSYKNRNHIEDNSDNGFAISNSVAANGEENFPKKNPCSATKNPCLNNGLCWTNRAGQQSFGVAASYKCVCQPDYSGVHCETKTNVIKETGAMLDFRGFSFLELPKIENGAGRTVNIEVWIKVRSPNGLILYNGQEFGKADFVTLLVSNGHIQFLYDLGSGTANLTSNEPISLNKWHWIVASREGRDGRLQVDGGPVQSVRSPPTLSELNLELPLFVGGMSDMNMVHRDLGVLHPFDGVLQYIRVNGETYHKEISVALKDRIIHRYEGPPCGSSVSKPCTNGGTCFPRLDSFVCLCPAQYGGKFCENRNEVPGPVRFDGENYLKFPRKIPKHESFNFSDYDDFYNDNFDSQLDELFGEWSEDEVDATTDNPNPAVEEAGEEDLSDLDFVDDNEEFVPLVEHDDDLDVERVKAQRRNRIELVFRTTEEKSGVVLWTGRNPKGDEMRKGYLGVFLVNGYPELRVDLGAKNKKPVIIRSKVKVTDGRWHQVLIARRRRLIVLQVDGSIPQRATSPPGSNVLISDGRFWIGGVAGSVLPGDIPADYHQGFVGCVDLVRVEKRRLPLSKIAYANGIPFCEDDE